MGKNYREVYGLEEMESILKYWSNCCGDLHENGEHDLKDASELPAELQRAYRELYEEGNGCLEYLIEYDGKYYVGLVSEVQSSKFSKVIPTMDELYEAVKEKALKLYEQDLFKNTFLILGQLSGAYGDHEVVFLVPAMEEKDVYQQIEQTIYDGIWNTGWNGWD